ncbi:MAG: UDP-N-acetylmuramate--L-alanine ligase [Alphaproteobacteria bacterium]
MKKPSDIGHIHFVGIGGIGMSGIAELMHNLGYLVQGSDANASANVKRLQELKIPVAIGHDAANLDQAKVVVISSAIQPDNPEVRAARERFLPVVRRAEMLAELMRLKSCVTIAGTHGKTTTTSLVAALLDAGHFDPTVVNGGIINAYGTNAWLGGGEWMVVEADESDGSFLKLPAEVAIVTNIDPEHLDHYGDFEALKAAFRVFVEKVPFYGFAVMCVDHPEVQALIGAVEDRRIVTYGFSPQADVRIMGLRPSAAGCSFALHLTDRLTDVTTVLEEMRLPMPGRHNALNAAAAVAVADGLGVPGDVIRQALGSFRGVKRRFSHVGDWHGASIYDDYAHHPVEIEATLAAARQATHGRVLAVVQPHRYTRLRDLFDEFCTAFNHADYVLVAPVYEAGETPIEGFDRDTLIEGLRGHGHRHAQAIGGAEDLAAVLSDLVRSEDLIICLGAGSITHWANDLVQNLNRLEGAR